MLSLDSSYYDALFYIAFLDIWIETLETQYHF